MRLTHRFRLMSQRGSSWPWGSLKCFVRPNVFRQLWPVCQISWAWSIFRGVVLSNIDSRTTRNKKHNNFKCCLSWLWPVVLQRWSLAGVPLHCSCFHWKSKKIISVKEQTYGTDTVTMAHQTHSSQQTTDVLIVLSYLLKFNWKIIVRRFQNQSSTLESKKHWGYDTEVCTENWPLTSVMFIQLMQFCLKYYALKNISFHCCHSSRVNRVNAEQVQTSYSVILKNNALITMSFTFQKNKIKK